MLHNLEGEFVLLRVAECPHLIHDVLEVALHEVHGLAEPAPDGLPGVVLGLVAVVVTGEVVTGQDEEDEATEDDGEEEEEKTM